MFATVYSLLLHACVTSMGKAITLSVCPALEETQLTVFLFLKMTGYIIFIQFYCNLAYMKEQ